MNLKKLLGKRIQELRKIRNLKQHQLAETIGVAEKYISHIENGKSYPSSDVLENIAKAFDVDYKDLFSVLHHKNRDEIEAEINEMIKNSNDKDLKKVYRILCDIIK